MLFKDFFILVGEKSNEGGDSVQWLLLLEGTHFLGLSTFGDVNEATNVG